jgi:hypothetical protein
VRSGIAAAQQNLRDAKICRRNDHRGFEVQLGAKNSGSSNTFERLKA